MEGYTKAEEIRQYTEIVYYRDGEEIGREMRNDDHAYDASGHMPMTKEEIEDWG